MYSVVFAASPTTAFEGLIVFGVTVKPTIYAVDTLGEILLSVISTPVSNSLTVYSETVFIKSYV